MSHTPTPQQQEVIQAVLTEKMVKVEACAGSGKTSTLVLCAEAYREPSLYLAFNKVTADEAAAKFPDHVTCKTTHSMAYAAFGSKLRNKLNRPKGGYQNVAGTGSEIAKFYGISDVVIDEDNTISSAFIGLLVKATVTRFEQSADAVVTERHVPTFELKEKLSHAPAAVTYLVKLVHDVAQRLWTDRVNVNSIVLATHDTYLKMFQMSKPVFNGFKAVYVDEFQDTTPCVLDIIMNQREHMKVVMVGDARQAIYGWRGAINAMLMVDAPTRRLTKSFRYGQAVADVATAVLEGDMKITGFEKLNTVAGLVDMVDTVKPYTRLFRTNSALLACAIPEIQAGVPVALEIDTRDFVKVLESAVALYRRDKKGIKHDKIIPYQNWDELMGEVKNDPELGRISKAVQGGQASEWIETLSRFQNAADPHVTFTTAHKSKGREWKQVIVEGDFKSGYNEEGEWTGLPTEEQNLLYVACTRAQEVLQYNMTAAAYIDHYTSEEDFNDAVEGAFLDILEGVKREHNNMVREILEA